MWRGIAFFDYPGLTCTLNKMNFSFSFSRMLSAIVLVSLLTFTSCQIDHVSLKNFDHYLEEHKDCLISFYEKWCKECDNFDPVFQNLAADLTKEYEGMRVAKMDTEGDVEFLDLFFIKSYPALFYFHRGLPIAYRDMMDPDKIKHWVKGLRTRKPIKLESVEQVRSFAFPILYLFTADETSPLFKLIDNLAKKSQDHIIFYSASAEILSHWNISKHNQLEALGLKDQQIRLTMTGEYDFVSLENFLLTSKQPLMQKYSTSGVKSLLSKGVAVFLVFGTDAQAQMVRSDLQVWTSNCRNGKTSFEATSWSSIWIETKTKAQHFSESTARCLRTRPVFQVSASSIHSQRCEGSNSNRSTRSSL